MKAIIGHASALEYLRTDAPEQHRPELLRIFSAPPADCLTDLRTVERLDLERIGIRSAPIHLMAPDSFAKRSSKRVQYHTPRRFAPRTAFILAASGIYVSAPPTCFLQLSSQLSVAELALLGCELCGTYALGGVTGEEKTMAQREPVCTARDLRAYVASARKAHGYGARKAETAARYVLERAASPMEAALALLLTLPTRIGGYGLPAPQLNYRVTTSIADQSASDRAYRVCDVYWPEWRIDLEYDSDLHHSGGGKIAQDAIRRNELVGKRISVITATRQHLFRPELLRATAEQIARLMGRKLRIRTAGFEEKQEILRRQLLFPRHLVSQNEVGRTCEQNATW